VSGIGKFRKELGANVRSFRKKAGLSQEGLAEKADFHPVYISQVECGTKAVSVEALWKLSRALQVPVRALFRGL
jgi:XRE family transcriptional regulator, regulator of sulfur utilization